MTPADLREALARTVHGVHGTRGLSIGVAALLLSTLLEPVFGPGLGWVFFTVPVLVLLVTGLLTLPREGVAVQDRILAVARRPGGPSVLLRHAVLPAVLLMLLWPQVFLAAYGIPHMSPLTGFVLPSLQRRLAVAYLFVVLWLPLLALRRTRGLAAIEAVRPRSLPAHDPRHDRREALLLLLVLLGVSWLFLLRTFWQPFTLLMWPPGASSLITGTAGVARLAYTVLLPAALYLRGSAHAVALAALLRDGWRLHMQAIAVLLLHLGLVLGATALAVYDLLWIVDYQASVRF